MILGPTFCGLWGYYEFTLETCSMFGVDEFGLFCLLYVLCCMMLMRQKSPAGGQATGRNAFISDARGP